jgi:Na+/melibiose symporter-like transporter
VVGGLLFQPVSQHLRVAAHNEKQDERIKLLEQPNDDEDQPENEAKAKKLTFFAQISKILDLDLLKDPAFCSLILGLALTYTSSINFSLIFPYYLQNTAKLTRKETAYCMSVLAGADILSRLTFPTITDKLKVRCRSAFLFGTVLLIIVRSILAVTTNQTGLIVISAFYGFIRAMTVVNQNLTISEFCRQTNCDAKLASALGLNMVGKGICVITLGQLLGWVGDATQSYAICLHAQNVCLAVMIALWTTERWCCRPRTRSPNL